MWCCAPGAGHRSRAEGMGRRADRRLQDTGADRLHGRLAQWADWQDGPQGPARAGGGRTDRPRLRRRHQHRVVRLLHLRHGCSTGLPQAVLSRKPLAARRPARLVLGFSSGLHRPAGGRHAVGHFGDVIGRKRAPVAALVMMGLSSALVGIPPLCAHRCGGPAAAGRATVLPRPGHRRPMGWGGAGRRRERAAGQAGALRQPPQLGVPAGMILANIVSCW